MRIAIATWESLHSISVGGVAVHATELAAALARGGHEPHVFTRLGPGQRRFEVIDGVCYHRCSYEDSPDFVDGIDNMCRAFVRSFEAVTREHGPFDIFHAHDWLVAEAMIAVKKAYGIPAILTMHSTEYGRCGNKMFGGFSQRIRDHERRGLQCADRVIAVSRNLRREVCRIYDMPEPSVSIVYNGIDPSVFDKAVDTAGVRLRYAIGTTDPMILFAGRLTAQKGPDHLLRAMPIALRRHPNAKFVFAGDGDMRGPLQLEAARLKVAQACRFVGMKNGADLIDLFRACDVVAVPSRNEPFGIVILEAWAAGKPVVATLNGGPAEFVYHEITGLKVYPNEDSIAEGVVDLLDQPERARWMGRNGRIAAETAFSWDAIASRTADIYASAAEPGVISVGPSTYAVTPHSARAAVAGVGAA